MLHLPLELLENIYKYSNSIDLNVFKNINQLSYQFASKILKELYINDFVKDKRILKILSKINKEDIEFLPFQKNFLGSTNYIDQITIEDLDKINPNKSIFIGKDIFNRPFITFKYEINFTKKYIDYKKSLGLQEPPTLKGKENNNYVTYICANTIFEEKLTIDLGNILEKIVTKPWVNSSYYDMISFLNNLLFKHDIMILTELFKTKHNKKNIKFTKNGIQLNELSINNNDYILDPITDNDDFDDNEIIYNIKLL